MSTTMTPLTERPAWKALVEHYQKTQHLHLRKLFADDPKRGERFAAEAAGIYLDYSKNRVNGETMRLLLELAESSGLRGPNQVVIVGSYRIGVGGDLIVAADGEAIDDRDTLSRLLTKKHGGDSIELTVYRNGRNERIRVKLGEAPQKF